MSKSTIIRGRYQFYKGTLAAHGLTNVTDTATGMLSRWFSNYETARYKRLIHEENETELFARIYCENYHGYIVRKNRFQDDYWCLDKITIKEGRMVAESFIFQHRKKDVVMAKLEELYPTVVRFDPNTYVCWPSELKPDHESFKAMETLLAETSEAEGWGVFDHDSTGWLEIQRIDEPLNGSEPKFDNDDDAERHVRQRGYAGSEVHAYAQRQCRYSQLKLGLIRP